MNDMTSALYKIAFDGRFLERGFWLYVWEITPPRGEKLYYVGRTGDSSWIAAQSPFSRMSQHLGFTKKSNTLRKHLESQRVNPQRCKFLLIAYGPVLREESRQQNHYKSRDKIAACEKALAKAMRDRGYEVINEVRSLKPLDKRLFSKVKRNFAIIIRGLRGHP
ncbi:MAG: hypothetical protein HYY44_07840 [Deltaproteobacteria bacterium]|nr:hypothetical protein [Deltaproteobacteria bacterium]